MSNEWWSIPLPSHAWETTRAHPTVGALQLAAAEDSSIDEHARLRPARVTGRPRVFGVTAPGDWARLALAHPIEVTESKRSDWFNTTGESRRWFIPTKYPPPTTTTRFTSASAYLTTPGKHIPRNDNGDATVSAGWNPDATWWLDLLKVAHHVTRNG